MKVEAIGGFDWDETNVGKLAVHGLKPNDVEDLFDFYEPVVFQHPEHRERWLALGVLANERWTKSPTATAGARPQLGTRRRGS